MRLSTDRIPATVVTTSNVRRYDRPYRTWLIRSTVDSRSPDGLELSPKTKRDLADPTEIIKHVLKSDKYNSLLEKCPSYRRASRSSIDARLLPSLPADPDPDEHVEKSRLLRMAVLVELASWNKV